MMIPVLPRNWNDLPAGTVFVMRESNAGEAVAPVPESSQATVTWPELFWSITSCGCVSCCGPKLPPMLAVTTPLKLFPPSEETISSARFGLKFVP